jgi:hypothetical protein
MSDGYDINEGECYRHIWTHVLVRITKVRWHEGISGLVYWETLNETKIDSVTSVYKRRSTSWKTSTLYTFAPLSLRKASLAGLSSSAPDPCDALLPNAGIGATDKETE